MTAVQAIPPLIDAEIAQALLEDRHPAPQQVLGPHRHGGVYQVGLLLPGAHAVSLLLGTAGAAEIDADRVHPDGVFLAILAQPCAYRLRIDWPDGCVEIDDAQAFKTLLSPLQLDAFASNDPEAHRLLGATPIRHDGVDGIRFAVWAPHASRVAVVGGFNRWDPRRHPMQRCVSAGLWELFIPEARSGDPYQYRIVDAQAQPLPLKADPVARQSECPPRTASLVPADWRHHWHDTNWLAARRHRPGSAPLSIYELHTGSWQRHPDGQLLHWDELAEQLIPYVTGLGFTHIELLPIAEHPFGGSWGYQPLGMYAPTARHGEPAAFARFVDRCHQAGLGVILDWVSAHFPGDDHGLACFDGSPLYEYADPCESRHPEWNTLIYDYGRAQVAAYLIGSALEWIERFHLDGLRVDAVASMLYRDYGRQPGEWKPNHLGGRENLEAITFLQALNQGIRRRHPDVLLIAEESTTWPGVTAPVEQGGLGFSYKWNLGWMHDTLDYMGRDPAYRGHHHTELTFGLLYAFSEHFLLPLSHDEVVHCKGSLIDKMAGADDYGQRFANLRAYYGFMWGHPGSKLLFMGCEFAQWQEWNHDLALSWELLVDPAHAGIQLLVRDLNRLLRDEGALYRHDDSPEGFDWVIVEDTRNSVFAFLRYGDADDAPMLVISHFTPVVRYDYHIGVPRPGRWVERLNSDAACYGGSNIGNYGGQLSHSGARHGHAQHLRLTLPPLATIYLSLEPL